jgi:hypothetical protein
MLHLALHEIYLGREANLVSINPASSRFSRFVALPCRQHISHVRTLSNANSVSSLCAMKLSSTLIFIAFLGNKDKVPKTASEDNLSDFRLVCTVGTLGVIFPTSLSRIGPSTCPNWSYHRAHNFGSQTIAIRGRLSLRIYTERSCCSGLWEYLSGWVDLIGKPPSP